MRGRYLSPLEWRGGYRYEFKSGSPLMKSVAGGDELVMIQTSNSGDAKMPRLIVSCPGCKMYWMFT